MYRTGARSESTQVDQQTNQIDVKPLLSIAFPLFLSQKCLSPVT